MKVENKYHNNFNGFGKVITFNHMICRYFGKFLLQGVNRSCRQSGFFYLGLSLTLGECLLVNP